VIADEIKERLAGIEKTIGDKRFAKGYSVERKE